MLLYLRPWDDSGGNDGVCPSVRFRDGNVIDASHARDEKTRPEKHSKMEFPTYIGISTMASNELQTMALPDFTESELLDLLATLDDEVNSTEEQAFNVILGDVFTLECFAKSITPNKPDISPDKSAGTMPTCSPSNVGAKRALTHEATHRPKRCRKTRKQEIEHLRAVAVELEKKLKEINEAHNQYDTGDPNSFWKCESAQLLEQRQKSAMENARLRDLVREQMAAFKALQRSLVKTPLLSQNDVFPTAKERVLAPSQSKDLYQDLFRNLSALHSTGVDRMLTQPTGLSPSLEGNKKVKIEIEKDSDDGLQMCLQVMENKLVPFSFEKIRDQAWKILTGTNGNEDFQLTIQNQGDEMFGQCKLDNAMGPMQLLGNIAVRQYVEADKLTIIWECEGDVHQGTSKTRIQPKGWCVFEPAERDPANATIFRRCAILSPIIPDDPNSERSIGTTTEVVLENYKRTVVYIFDGRLTFKQTFPIAIIEMALFSEAELLDVLTGIDANSTKDSVPGPSVNVVLNADVLSSEQAFEDFMESLTSDEDAGVLMSSDGNQSESTNSSSSSPPVAKSNRSVDIVSITETSAPTAAKPKRKRRKHELDHLRAVAAELEKKLKVLNKSSSDEQPDAGQFWKHISNQLMTERQKAVGENARLRQLVREQVKSVKAMQRTLNKTPDLSKMGIASECSAANLTQSPPASKDLYRELFQNISSSYSSGVGNMLLQQPCMPAPSLVGKRKMNMEMETTEECGPRMCLQFVESRLIPCSLLRIGDHAWDFLSGSNGHEDFHMALQTQGNELFGHCTVNNPCGSTQALCNIAVRRYYEANKLTFVWECDGLCSDEDSSMRVHQTGWCVFEPAEDSPHNATIFRACARMTPSLTDTSDHFTDSAKAVGKTTEMVIENYEKTVVYIFDAVLDSLTHEAPSKVA
ncbi:hypothetical protein P3T76_006926 [Phytophthora citrophthora]|uniref:START domain-containing protein n=1 Tax=Phytophthora citrophthora TaxID=4793 RepID=A0AAD9GNR7_9STRA|nr:hypothetical protein P3T76_006926 [Phytophthora citrophthora]